jgi:alpha-L-fucosidase
MTWQRANTDWLHAAQWGTFTHYLADQPSTHEAATIGIEDWQRQVDAVDVAGLARSIADTGARYHFLTLGQNSGYYCSPNATYDAIVGEPSRLSKRDLVLELADALAAYDVRLMVYLPAHAPAHHREAVERLGFTPSWDASAWGIRPGTYLRQRPTDDRLSEGQRHWESIIREWSLRWGGKVHGWWIDGAYFADRMYRHADEPNFSSFAAALKAGHPDALIAFNPGVRMPVVSVTEYEDYTAGECDSLVAHDRYRPLQRFVNGAQLHVLSYLGEFWRVGEPRFSDALAAAYTRHVVDRGGVVTWDVPIDAAGRVPDVYLGQLAAIGKAVPSP